MILTVAKNKEVSAKIIKMLLGMTSSTPFEVLLVYSCKRVASRNS